LKSARDWIMKRTLDKDEAEDEESLEHDEESRNVVCY